jgi:hypothetical protein
MKKMIIALTFALIGHHGINAKSWVDKPEYNKPEMQPTQEYLEKIAKIKTASPEPVKTPELLMEEATAKVDQDIAGIEAGYNTEISRLQEHKAALIAQKQAEPDNHKLVWAIEDTESAIAEQERRKQKNTATLINQKSKLTAYQKTEEKLWQKQQEKEAAQQQKRAEKEQNYFRAKSKQ